MDDKFTLFRNRLNSDGKLAEEYGGILERRRVAKGTKFSGLDDAAMGEIIEFAGRAGFSFTLEEVRAYFAGSGRDELSDFELESVAGGKGKTKEMDVYFYYNEKNDLIKPEVSRNY